MNGFGPRDALEMLLIGPFSQIWPMLLLPAVAGLISDRTARLLPPTKADWRIAAALAAFPGLVMLALIGVVAGWAFFHLHYDGLSHLAKFHLPLAFAFGVLGRAVWRHCRRSSEISTLIRVAQPPSSRLRAAAADVSIRVREIEDKGCECFVAGVLHPTAYVSSGTLSRMNDAELRAALHHERAHAAGNDPAMLAGLSFLRDLAPGTDRSLTAYRQARERRADAEAARMAGPCVVASALLAVVRSKASPVTVMGMAATDAGAWRLQALLGTEPEHAPSSKLPLVLWVSLAANTFLTVWPLAHLKVVKCLYLS